MSGGFVDVVRLMQCAAALGCRAQDADRNRMGRGLLAACRQSQKLFFGYTVCRLNLRDRERAVGQRAGFIHDSRLDAGERLQ